MLFSIFDNRKAKEEKDRAKKKKMEKIKFIFSTKKKEEERSNYCNLLCDRVVTREISQLETSQFNSDATPNAIWVVQK